MLRRFRIQNYKSILDDTIELGRINVFIGENGCGKTNLLEAAAMASAALTDRLDADELFGRGIRLAKPSLTKSAFREQEAVGGLRFELTGSDEPHALDQTHKIQLEHAEDGPHSRWAVRFPSLWPGMAPMSMVAQRLARMGQAKDLVRRISDAYKKEHGDEPSLAELLEFVASHSDEDAVAFATLWDVPLPELAEFVIYNPSILALRGLQTESRKEPLGLYGEGLDVAIGALDEATWRDVVERARCIAWMDDAVIDVSDRLKGQGFKLGRSTSTLYFVDRFMAADNNVFSAENANEGVLHVLFYLTLFLGRNTPKIFGIDNIETALNPQLCRDLIKQLAELAVLRDKQALITTHNPAILDGLNLHDDEQRLFVVYRNDSGHTITRRIKAKPQPHGQTLKLSELWMRGHLGGLPRNF